MELVKVLSDRVELIKTELEKVREKLLELNKQTQDEQANFHRVNGHLNEATFLLSEAQKGNAPSSLPEGEVNGEVNNQEAEQPA